MDLSEHESNADDNDHSEDDDSLDQTPAVEEAENGAVNHLDDDSSKLNNDSDSDSEEDDRNQENVPDECSNLDKHGNNPILDTKPAQRNGWGWKALVATTPLVSSKAITEVVPTSSNVASDASMEEPQPAPLTLTVPTHTTNMRGGRDIDDESVSDDSDHNECVDEGGSCDDISNGNNLSEVMVVNRSNESAPAVQRKGWGWKALVTSKTISGEILPENKPVQSQTHIDEENEEKDDSRESDDKSTLDNGDNDGVDDMDVNDNNDVKACVSENNHPDDSVQAAQRNGWGWKALAAKTISSASKTSDVKATTASSVTSLAESKKDHCTGTSVIREAMSPSDFNLDIGSDDDEDSDNGDNLEKQNTPTNMVLDDMGVNSIVSSPEKILEGTMTTPPIPPLDLNTVVSDESDCDNEDDVSEGSENVRSDDDCDSGDPYSEATPPVPPLDTNVASSDVFGSENECMYEAGENNGLNDDSEFDGSNAEAPPPVPPLDMNIDVSEECGSNCDDVTEGSVNVSSDDDNDCDDQDSEGRDANSDPDSCGGSEISEELEMHNDRNELDLHDNDALVNIGNTDDDRNISVYNNDKENTGSDDSDTNSDTTIDCSLEKFNSENVTLDERVQISIKTTADMKPSPNDALDCCSIEQHEASEKSSSCLNSSSGSLLSQSESMKEESDERSDSCSSNMEPRGNGSDLGKSFEIVNKGKSTGSQPKGIDSSSLHESNHVTGTSNSIPCTETEFPKDEIEACDDSAIEAEKSYQGSSQLIEDRPASKVLSHQLSNESLSESVASGQRPGSNAEENHVSKTENKRGWGWFAKKNSVQNETVSTGVGDIPTNSFSSEELNVQESKDANVAGATGSKSETARRPWGWFAAKNQNDDSDDSQSESEHDVLKAFAAKNQNDDSDDSQSESEHDVLKASDHEQSKDSPKSLDDNVDFSKGPTHVMQQTIVLDNNLFPEAVETESHSLPDENEPCLLQNSPDNDSEDSLSANSNSDDETNHSSSGKPFRLVVKQAPLLRLENVTSSTRNKITDDRDQKKDKTWWFSKKNESGDKSDFNSKSVDVKSSINIHEKPGIDSETLNELENVNDSLIDNSATYGIGADPQAQLFASDEGKQASSEAKQRKKKKSKVSDISTLLESRKSTRLVSRHGDEVSVGTLNIKAQEPSRIVVLSASNALLDESELCPRSRPWEKSIRKGPRRSHSSNQNPSPLEDINILSSDIEVLFQNDPFESTNDMFSKDTTKSNVNMHMPSLHEEDESDDNDNVSVSKETADGTSLRGNIIEDVDGMDTLLEITDLEQRLIESNDSCVKMDFDQMWDDVSCDGSTALEFDRIKRKRNHEKERKRKRREKEKSEKDNAARRLRLFERRKERDDQLPVTAKKASEMQSKLSEEFVDAIHKVFDDGSVNSLASSVEQSTAGVDNFDECSKNGSCHSLYLPSEVSENNEDDKSHSSGNENSKSQINGQKSPFEEASVDGMGTVSLSKNKAKSKGNRQHGKKIKKGKKRSKRSEIDSSEIFLAEVERLKKPKVFTIASLKQEMIDRRGTSVNFLKKEYVNYRKKRNDRRKVPLDNELKPLDFGALSEQMKNKKVDEKADIFDSAESKSDSGGLGAKLSRWVATEGVTGLDDLATVVENSAPSHNIFGVAANLAKNAAAAIPEIPLSQDIQALGRDAGKVITSAGTTIYSGGQTLGTNVAQVGERVGRTVGSNLSHGTHAIADGINQGTHAVGKGINRVGLGGGTENVHRTEAQTEATSNQTSGDDMNLFTANFSDMPLTSIQEIEDDDDDDFGLLASHKKDHNDDSYNDDDGDDGRSHEIRSAGGSRLPFKMGKLKPPKLGKTIKKLVPKLPSMQKRGDSGRSGGFRMGGSNKGYGGMGLLD